MEGFKIPKNVFRVDSLVFNPQPFPPSKSYHGQLIFTGALNAEGKDPHCGLISFYTYYNYYIYHVLILYIYMHLFSIRSRPAGLTDGHILVLLFCLFSS